MQLREYNAEQIEKILDSIHELQQNNETFIMFGTLLGAVREQGLIAHDDDIDLAYLSKYCRISDVRKEMYDIYKKYNDKGQLQAWFGKKKYWELPSWEKFNGRGQAHIAINGYGFDLWTAWIDDSGRFNCHPALRLGVASEFLPFTEYELYGRKFKSISNAELFLERFYGDDWQIPQNKKDSYKNHDKGVLLK